MRHRLVAGHDVGDPAVVDHVRRERHALVAHHVPEAERRVARPRARAEDDRALAGEQRLEQRAEIGRRGTRGRRRGSPRSRRSRAGARSAARRPCPRLRSWRTSVTFSGSSRPREQLARPVRRPVVDDDELAGVDGQLRRERVVDRALDRRALVVDGHQDRQRGRHRRRLSLSAVGLRNADPLCVGTCARDERYDRAVRELVIDGTPDRRRHAAASSSPRSATTTRARSRRRRSSSVPRSECGVDAVKLQKRDNRALYTRALYDAPYDNENSFGPTYGAHREALELDRDEYVELQAYARELGLDVLRDRVRRRERRPARRARRAGVQDRLGRPAQHAAAAARRRDRQADDRLHRRRDARGRRPRRRGRDGRSTRSSACCSARPPTRPRSRSSTSA